MQSALSACLIAEIDPLLQVSIPDNCQNFSPEHPTKISLAQSWGFPALENKAGKVDMYNNETGNSIKNSQIFINFKRKSSSLYFGVIIYLL